jgi:hypothetical protein
LTYSSTKPRSALRRVFGAMQRRTAWRSQPYQPSRNICRRRVRHMQQRHQYIVRWAPWRTLNPCNVESLSAAGWEVFISFVISRRQRQPIARRETKLNHQLVGWRLRNPSRESVTGAIVFQKSRRRGEPPPKPFDAREVSRLCLSKIEPQ